jgi:hypothetical protein
MGNQLDGDLSEERRFFLQHKGKKYLPKHCLEVLPEKWKRPPGSLVTFYKCLPPGIYLVIGYKYFLCNAKLCIIVYSWCTIDYFVRLTSNTICYLSKISCHSLHV